MLVLTNLLKENSKSFEKEHPNINVKLIAAGSLVVARKITDLNQISDLAFVADYTIIPEFLYDKYANFNVIFSNNSIVLAYTNKSKFSNVINENSWYKIIFKKGGIFGHSNPDLDPAGYRTLMVIKLIQDFYSSNNLYENFTTAKNKFILKKIEIEFKVIEDNIEIFSTTKTHSQTGVEMEALTAVNIAALTIYDM